MKRRWLVERTQNVFDDVGAEWFDIKDGALWFYNKGAAEVSTCSVIYAPGQWLTVVPNHQEDQ